MKILASIFFIFTITTAAAQAGRIEVEIDRLACHLDMGWMDIDIKIDGETYSFSPNCMFEVDETFTTSNGHTCRLKSSMCAHVRDSSSLAVSCDFQEGVKRTFPCRY
ncbi:MAG: hypothetical protein KDD38_10760 [Bdellovibrionales bacterium]|nr:hypothetical protein [Bdellovibrionales bacterium]